MPPAVVPRTAPSSVAAIGAPPERELRAAVLVPAVAAVAPAVARVSAASAAQQAAASGARRQWVVFMNPDSFYFARAGAKKSVSSWLTRSAPS
jgi:hypothetical protein